MELIFEIGCEELPASFVEPGLEQLRRGFLKACEEARIDVDADSLRLLATPRRLTLLVSELAERQRDLEEVRTGPPAAVAFKDGKPTGAAQGFARGQGVSIDDLYTVETEKGEYLAAKVFETGRPTTELLPAMLTELVESLHFPKSMRWGAHKESFGRPVRWLLAIADKEPVAVQFAGVPSGTVTFGHRFAAPAAIEVRTIEDYVTGLEKACVMLEPEERRQHIRALCEEHATKAGGRIVEDPELVFEVANLIEMPHGVTLAIDERYLELPREVLISSMRSHQRYFAVEEKDGSALKGACVVIYNTPVRDPRVVAEGNLKVLRARLDDARFFWDKDLQTPLAKHVESLEDVIWIGPLGSMRSRSERIATLADRIGELLELSVEERDQASRAGLLSKADLVTHMVDEFPDLQGVMGSYYARKAGEPEAVAVAVAEQYLPKSADDAVPSTRVSACVALAEKLDAIAGAFGVDMIPTSTSDPYGLRRSALGTLRILRELNLTVSPAALVQAALETYGDNAPFSTHQAVADKILEFLSTRQHYMLTDEAPTDVVKAVLNTGISDVPSVVGRIHALDALRHQPDFEPLALGFKRVVNILTKQAQDLDLSSLTVDVERFEDDAERNLFQAYGTAQATVTAALSARHWDEACNALIALKEPVDTFFDSVMVMTDDEDLKKNRIALLATLKDLFFRVADISEIQT